MEFHNKSFWKFMTALGRRTSAYYKIISDSARGIASTVSPSPGTNTLHMRQIQASGMGSTGMAPLIMPLCSTSAASSLLSSCEEQRTERNGVKSTASVQPASSSGQLAGACEVRGRQPSTPRV